MPPWFTIESAPPNAPVMTKIDDENGVRNTQVLVRKGRLWWHKDESTYVYYTPTHWRHLG
jgi:hypothetical protein